MPCINNMRIQAPHRSRAITVPQRRRRLSRRRLSAHCVLSTVSDWEFNVFTMDTLTNGRSLFNVGLRMLQDHGLIETFKLDIVKVMRCLSLIEEGYLSTNPYHNSIHGADVAQAMNCYLHEPKLCGHVTQVEKMTCIFSALAHDVAHPGVSNAFLINTNNHLAALYNNESVLENHHWRTTMSIFHQTGIFQHLDKTTQGAIESKTKSLILATDISKQQQLLNKFKNGVDSNNLNLAQDENRSLVLQIAIKCADLSNTTRPWDVSSKWSALVCQEFFKQGDIERKLGMEVTPLNDRYNADIANIQAGFMKFVVTPLFSEWKRFNSSELSHKMLQNLQANMAEWERRKSQGQESSEKKQEEMAEGNTNSNNAKSKPSEKSSTKALKVAKKRSYSIPDGNHAEGTGNPSEDLDNDDVILEPFNDFQSKQFASRRHSLPPSVFCPESRRRSLCGESGCNSRVPCPFTALAEISFNAARRQSLPLPVVPHTTLDVLEESPTINKTIEFEQHPPFDAHTVSDDTNETCDDNDYTILPAITYKLWDDCVERSKGHHYNTKRRRSAPNTHVLIKPEHFADLQKCNSDPERSRFTSNENLNEDIAQNQLYNALLSRRRSLPIKSKDVSACQKLLARLSPKIRRATLRRRNSLPVSVLAENMNLNDSKENMAHEYFSESSSTNTESAHEFAQQQTKNKNLAQLKTDKQRSKLRLLRS